MNIFIFLKRLSFLKKFFQQFFRVKIFALLFTVGLCMTLGFSGCTSNTQNSSANSANNTQSTAKVVRIGYVKSGTLALVKQQGTLEKRLSPNGITVKWTEFPHPLPSFQAMNAGNMDFTHASDGPPIFAQSAGVPLVYLASTPPSPESLAILVHQDSPIKTVTDLKGKKIAFNKGSTSSFLVMRALEQQGMQFSDIQPTYLSGVDARAAFEGRNVDAWATQDPSFAAVQNEGGARILKDGKGLVTAREYYFASRDFANTNPQIIQEIIDEIEKTGNWAKDHPRQVAELLSPKMGVDVTTLELSETRRKRYGIKPINNEVVSEQQKLADNLLRMKLITKPVKVADAVWQPQNESSK
ncbi:aliphatic sulfonate ABC transporter substrate-binding protein [Westiellopsis prolifica IICB1]|nr:aliphatic sulfonate ABC transporter substrate-binding protein [Westiellopsis prolifica IICB1]